MITDLERGELFSPKGDPSQVYVLEEYGQSRCVVRRIAFLTRGIWRVNVGKQESYNSYAVVVPVKVTFTKCAP